jgi:multiple sugar transport system substrate-binding protein
LPAPRTWQQLVSAATAARRRGLVAHGFVWQGKQYEGLVCNALEFVWSHGGDIPPPVDARATGEALGLMRSLVTDGTTPPFVTTLTEEPSRVIFGQGRALFMRNWPYAWELLNGEGSEVRDRVGVAALPFTDGHASAATLGGWQLGVNAHSTRPALAEHLVAFLAAPAAQKSLALAYGYCPPRASLYDDGDLSTRQPFLASLRDVFEKARPRPVSPAYVALSQVLQAEFSRVLTGDEAPDDALGNVVRAVAELDAR